MHIVNAILPDSFVCPVTEYLDPVIFGPPVHSLLTPLKYFIPQYTWCVLTIIQACN